MASHNIQNMLSNGWVIPAVRSLDDFEYAVTCTTVPSIILLCGDINMLPALLKRAQQYRKRLLLHVDLFDGIGKDKAGIKYLSKLGVQAIITTKPQLGKIAREEGMTVIQRLFLMDSEALKTGIHLLRNFKPDAVEIMPASVPAYVVKELIKETRIPVLAGGLVRSADEVTQALKKGISAVSSSSRELWIAQQNEAAIKAYL